ncbi:MAG: ATP-binding cassette domain-containing protein [Candidatus Sumerlaeota bacterium]|nr:ATP-binding cassette domain-containing protein [Candidatus Sumerlaeota bacterium]
MLEINNLHVAFNRGSLNQVCALRGVTLAVGEGSFVTIIGTNGSGKSTLLNAIAGPLFPDAGCITLDGKNITAWPEHKRARLIGRVFQNPFTGTAPAMTIEENLALAAKRGERRGLGWALKPGLRSLFRTRVSGLKLGLEDRLGAEIGTLSGGQRQALTLLMASWKKPRLLLLDEHTAALDPKSAEQIVRMTREIVARERMTTIMITHSMHQAVSLGERLVMMHRGAIAYDVSGAEKRRLRASDLLGRFEELRRMDQLDLAAAEMLRETYV